MANNSLIKFHSFDNHRVLIPAITASHPKPRIYVICMASYEQGQLYGTWIDLSQPLETTHREIKTMIASSPTENALQWAIYAFGGFRTLTLSFDEDFELIHKKAYFLSNYGDWISELIDYYDGDIYKAEEAIINHYQGKFSNELEFAESLFDKECSTTIPDHMKFYIDYTSFKRDIFQNDYFSFETNNGVHVFSFRII